MKNSSSRRLNTLLAAWLKLALRMVFAVVLLGGIALPVRSDDAPADQLSITDIFKRVEEKYASLSSYADEGKVFSAWGAITSGVTFSIRMARPSSYRIEWEPLNPPAGQPNPPAQAVWSGGAGDYSGDAGKAPKKQPDKEAALSLAAGDSECASSSIPGIFFRMNWAGQLFDPMLAHTRRADEKLGSVDCHVIAGEGSGITTLVWIGKQDFLIHQIRRTTSAAAIKAMQEGSSLFSVEWML